MGVTGLTRTLDRGLHNLQDALLDRSASGNVHIVEMDAKSIAKLKQWPWPRSAHARAIDALSAAGAAAIVFDIDFSSTTDPVEDATLAGALARSKSTVVLPTFRQQAGDVAQGTVESLPAPAFRDHAFLASVNVHPDADGIMRRYSTGTVTDGVARPSLAAVISNFAGRVEDSFPIDNAIDPDTIPRHSYIDLIEGRVPARALAGKQVLIGATAIELGDRYVLPRHGVLPGVVAQALAADTLIAGRLPIEAGWLPAMLMALLPAWLLTGRRSPAAFRLLLHGSVGAILIGTYVLSAGYYDAYYIRAQKVRKRIFDEFTDAFGKCDLILTPSAPSAAFALGEKSNDPVQMYLNDVFTVTANLAGLPGASVPAGLDAKGLPLGLQLIARPFDEETMFKGMSALEQAAAFNARPVAWWA